MSVNKVILVGNLGKDPELRNIGSGTTVCTFSLATTDRFKNKQGEQQERTEWHNIVVWAGLAEICGKYLYTQEASVRWKEIQRLCSVSLL